MGQTATRGLTLPVAIRLGRVSNLPTIWSNVLAGVALSGRTANAATIVLLMLAFSLLYTGGMFLNDAFDREIDRKERPERPIPSGEVAARVVFTSGFGMLAAGWLLLLIGGNIPTMVSGFVLVAAIVLYNSWHKANPISPAIMGACRALVYLTAGLAVAANAQPRLVLAALMLFAYLIGLSYAAKQEGQGHLDRLWPLALLAAPLIYTAPTALHSIAGVAAFVIFLGWTLYALAFLVVPSRRNVPRGVVSLIAGISLLDALFAACVGRADFALLAGCAFLLTLFLQQFIAAT